MRAILTSLVIILLLLGTVNSAGVPNIINYSGSLSAASGDPVPDGSILVKFTIYDLPVGGTTLWNSGFQSVITTSGLFDYDLGSIVTLPDLFGADSSRYLGITVSTDPEMTPRTRITTTAYSFRSLKSDHAYNSDSLGGIQPSFYLDWGNITGMPAGFADGVDDGGGISQATADLLYVEVSGDVMNGNLIFDGDNDGSLSGRVELFPDAANIELWSSGQVKTKIWGETSGHMNLWDASGDLGISIGAGIFGGTLNLSDTGGVLMSSLRWMGPDGGQLQLADEFGTTTLWLKGGATGNGSAVLPDNAISSSEILGEAGIATNKLASNISLSKSNTSQNYLSVNITTPMSGYIVVEGNVYNQFWGTTSANYAWVQLSEVSNAIKSTSDFQWIGEGAYVGTGNTYRQTSIKRVYFKSAGSYNFFLQGNAYSLNDASAVTRTVAPSWIQATFYPTSYGTVITGVNNPGDHPDAEKVDNVNENGEIITSYKIDLRYYEEKARTAEIAKQKAELEAIKTRIELERARQVNNE